MRNQLLQLTWYQEFLNDEEIRWLDDYSKLGFNGIHICLILQMMQVFHSLIVIFLEAQRIWWKTKDKSLKFRLKYLIFKLTRMVERDSRVSSFNNIFGTSSNEIFLLSWSLNDNFLGWIFCGNGGSFQIHSLSKYGRCSILLNIKINQKNRWFQLLCNFMV